MLEKLKNEVYEANKQLKELGALDKSRAIHYGRYLHKENSVKAA